MNHLKSKSYVERIDCQSPQPEIIRQAVDLLVEGQIIVAPTETCYGLLARVDRDDSLNLIFRLKRRSTKQPVAVFVGSAQMMMHYVQLNPMAQRLAGIFLPGALTLVLPALAGWDNPVVYNDTVGLRVSSSPVIQAIMQQVSFPVTATSANISGQKQDTNIEAIRNTFAENVSLYLDGGELDGLPSTIVDCTGDKLTILREGAIPADEILAAMGEGRK